MISTSNWNKRYLELAKHVSSWSKDPSTKIGSVAVGNGGQILSLGYNGFPRNIEDDHRLIDREIKYSLVVHAEMNVIYNASLNGVSLKDSTLYVHGLPICSECAKGVIQVGIKKVVMQFDKNINKKWTDSFKLTKNMFTESNISFIEYDEELINDG